MLDPSFRDSYSRRSRAARLARLKLKIKYYQRVSMASRLFVTSISRRNGAFETTTIHFDIGDWIGDQRRGCEKAKATKVSR